MHPGDNKESVPLALAIIMKLPLVLPDVIFLLDQIYLDF